MPGAHGIGCFDLWVRVRVRVRVRMRERMGVRGLGGLAAMRSWLGQGSS